MTRIMHRNGMNHRDLYICHFKLNVSILKGSANLDAMRLHIIDLHRAKIRSVVPRRWLVKDIGSLYFSILNIGFTRNDIFRFLTAYYQQPLRVVLSERAAFLHAAKQRAVSLYVRDFNKQPLLPC